MALPIAPSDWPRLLTLLDEALDIAAAKREGWLSGLDVPAPLRAALAELLAQRLQLETDDFLSEMPAPLTEPALMASPFSIGSLIGPWQLLRPLGQGGMSVVWLAQRHDGQVTRQVALKLPHAGPGQDVLARRLLRERKILAALAHPHIARLYDVGLTDGGTPYLVMEYVPGDTLLAHADARGLTVTHRVELFQQVLGAVQYAHSQLVLHRDLKPANILVTPEGQVMLLDFGIAKLMRGHGPSAEETELTQAAGRQLTLNYASPEQLRGQEPGTASDVYSLGVLLCELLCGQRPHESDGGSDGGHGARLESAVLNEEPRAPSRRSVSDAAAQARATTAIRLARQLRGDLDAIVLKALALLPAQRYASAEAFASDLRRWQTGRPVLARAPGAGYYLRKFVRRHRWSVAASSIGVVALVSAAGYAAVQGWAARQEAQRAATARDFLLELFADAAPERLGGINLTATELLERGRQKATDKLGNEPRLQAELLAGIGLTQLQRRDMTGADAALARAADLFHNLGDPLHEATARLNRLEVAQKDGQFDRTASLLAALQPLQATVQGQPLLHLRWLCLSGAQTFSAKRDVMPADLERCLALADERDPAQATIMLWARTVAAEIAARQGQPAAALAHLDAAERLPPPAAPYDVADKAAWLALARASTLMFDDGFGRVLTWLPASIERCDRGLGRNHSHCAELRTRRLWALLRVGDGAGALALADELLPAMQQTHSLYAQFSTAYVWVRVLAANGHTTRSHPAIRTLEALALGTGDKQLPAEYQLSALAALTTLQLRAGDIAGAERWVAQADALSARLAKGEQANRRRIVELASSLSLQARGAHEQALQAMGTLCRPTQPASVVDALDSLNCTPSLIATGQRAQALAVLGFALSGLSSKLGPDYPATQRTRDLLEQLQSPGYRLPAWQGSQIFISGIR